MIESSLNITGQQAERGIGTVESLQGYAEEQGWHDTTEASVTRRSTIMRIAVTNQSRKQAHETLTQVTQSSRVRTS